MNLLAMNLPMLLDESTSGRVCLTLLHSLWQVALLVAAVWVIDRLPRKSSVERGYALHVAALFLALAALPITYAMLPTPMAASLPMIVPAAEVPLPPVNAGPFNLIPTWESPQPPTMSEPVIVAIEAEPMSAAVQPEPTLSRWRVIAPWIVAIYALGVALMLLRLAVGSAKAHALCRRAVRIADGPLVDLLCRLAREWSLRARCRLTESTEVVIPQVIGLLRPTILLPAAAITGLAPRDLEMILVHELAHIRRHDVWVNFVQRLAEAILFFNPGLWYLSRRIGTLREYCCDELACRDMPGDTLPPRVEYATALLHVVELAKPGARTPEVGALAASGRGPSELRRRVARLFGEPLREPLRLSRGGVLAAVGMAVVLLAGPAWMGSRAQTPAEESQAEQSIGPALRGRIVDEQDKTLPGVKVVLYGGADTRFRGQETVTEKNGEYVFDPLTTGMIVRSGGDLDELRLAIKFEHERYVPADGQAWREFSVPLKSDHVETLNLSMTVGGRLSGTVRNAETGKPMPNVSLRLFNGVGSDERATYHAYASTDESGAFSSDALYPGRYVIDINDNDFEGDREYPKIGLAEVKAGETTTVDLTTRELPQLQDPFSITGTAKGEDGKSMVYGGVGVRLVGSEGKLRSQGGGIDGRNVFGLSFGPVERREVSEGSPYGVGTHDVEIFGSNMRFGYRLASRTPSEPLRITDDPTKPELQDGIRYIRPGVPVEFELVFEKVPEGEDQPATPEVEAAPEGEATEADAITIIGDKFVVAPVTTPLERSLLGSVERPAAGATTCVFVNTNAFGVNGAIDTEDAEWQRLAERLKRTEAKPEDVLFVRIVESMRDDVAFEEREQRSDEVAKAVEQLAARETRFSSIRTSQTFGNAPRNWRNTIEEAQRNVKEDGTGGLPLVDTEMVKVTIVSTFLAHMLVDADCVVDWLPIVRDADGARLMADVLPTVAEAMNKAETGGGETLLIRLRFSETEKPSLEKWANDIPARKFYAGGLGFELCNVSQSQIAEEDEEPEPVTKIVAPQYLEVEVVRPPQHKVGDRGSYKIIVVNGQKTAVRDIDVIMEKSRHLRPVMADENYDEKLFLTTGRLKWQVGDLVPGGRTMFTIESDRNQEPGEPEVNVQVTAAGLDEAPADAGNTPDADQVAALEELVKSYEQLHDNIKVLHEAQARGGSHDRLMSTRLALFMAKAELETAKGNPTGAVDHCKTAVEVADQNVEAQQQAYTVGTGTLDAVLDANRKRAEAKLALSKARKNLPAVAPSKEQEPN